MSYLLYNNNNDNNNNNNTYYFIIIVVVEINHNYNIHKNHNYKQFSK